MRRVVILAAAVAASVLAAPRAAVAQQTVDWTVLVYLNGDTSPGFTDLENASISDFNELEQVGSTSRVNIVCQWDRNDQTDNLDTYYADDSTQSWQGARRYLVTRDNNQTQNNLDPDEVNGNNGIEPNPGGNPAVGPHVGYRISSAALLDLGEVDMGQEQTLVDFCQWSFARFPARHYLLILNDTGRGWQPRSVRPGRGRGLMFDASTTGDASDNNAAVYLTNDELRSALTRVKALNGGTNLDIVALDAGGQGVLEVVYQLRETADYVVAPFLERPLDGFPYDRWLSTLVNSMPLDTTNIETMLGNYIADYFGSYLPGNTILGGSRSTAAGAFRMAQIEAVRLAVDNLAQALLDDLPTYATGILRALAQVQRGRTTDYTANYLDLVHFANLIAAEIDDPPVDNAAAAVPPAVTALLVNTTFGSSITGDLSLTNFNGVGIYFPADISNFDVNYSVSGDLVDATQWDELVQGVLTLNSDQRGPEIVIGSPLAGSTIIDNPPQVIATIVDLEAGGRINPQSIIVQIDGQTIPSSDYTFDATTGVLTYDIPNPLSVTSHTVTISARDLSGNLTSVTSSFRVAVPSLPVGVQTFSLPRVVTQAENNPALIFGSGNFTLVRWVPLLLGANKYRTYPDSYASFIPPDALPTLSRPTVPQPPAGLGYWVRVRQSRPVASLPGQPVTASEYPIRLYADPDGVAGWNMIANPYDVSAVGLASCLVLMPDGRRITFRQAIENGLTPGVLFTYVPNSANPNAGGTYDFQDAGEGQLTRLQGHWLRANQDFTLLVTSGARAATPARRTTRSLPAGGWSLDLTASSEAGSDRVILGASRQTSAGYDPTWDVAAPPVLPGGLQLRAVHGDWGNESGRYLRDLRGASEDQVWDLEVSGPSGEVTLAWPNLRGVPAGAELTLTDLTNGQARRMRSVGAYRFQHGGGARALRVVVGRANGSGLSLGAVTVTSGRGGGYQLGYSLTRAADLTLLVRSLSGRTLRHVTQSAAAAGRGELFWDGRGPDGRPVPNGVYQLELVATASDGATVRVLRTLRVVR